MIPPAFDYHAPRTIAEAISLLSSLGDDAKLLAGGHSLLPMMKLRLAQPSVLIDIGRLSDLSYIREEGDQIAIGAMTRHMDVETSDVLKRHVPLLAHAAGHVGDPEIARGLIERESPRIAQAISPQLAARSRDADERVVFRNTVLEARVGMVEINAQHPAQQVVEGLA